jgi:pimeloyl-ACP methyl ester carboxylesterase
MLSYLLVLGVLTPAQAPVVESRFIQVAPVSEGGKLVRTPGRVRSVVLLHGYRFHLSDPGVARADFRPWQRPGSVLVKELAADSEVFAFAYGQNAGVEDIVARSSLKEDVGKLRQLGYREVVLVGHSAGGLIARAFVEDHPAAVVTKVVQVCCPNGGCFAAGLKGPKSQRAFLECLTVRGREQCLKERAGKTIPERVEFVCVVGCGSRSGHSDGVIPCACQWTADLQDQGIPAVALGVGHREAVRVEKGARLLAELVRREQPRWPQKHVRQAREEILGR